MQKRMRILFAAAEASPFVKVGGLGDVAGSLPAALKAISPESIDIRVVMPFHQVVQDKFPSMESLGSFELSLGDTTEKIQVFTSESSGIPFYFLDNHNFVKHPAVYARDPELDGLKYAIFSIALLEMARFLKWKVDILHANDWHTALAVAALKDQYASDPFFINTKSILTIHNLPFNGYGAQSAMQSVGFTPSGDQDLPGWARYTPLPMGIQTSDKVVFVSKGYAAEVMNKEMGSGLDDYLQLHTDKIYGIVNGIDTKYWDPATDPYIPVPYHIKDMAGKLANKANLQAELGFIVNEGIPLLSVVSRLDVQKGLSLLLDGLGRIIDLPWQLALLGTGDPLLEEKARELQKTYPYRIRTEIKYDEALAHKLYAASDIFLMPSIYEPCGLSQMIAMRYGTIPIARATGGLVDTINDFSADPESSTGFLFESKTPEGFVEAMRFALQVYTDIPIWRRLQHNAMMADFSWQTSAHEYLEMYQSLFSNEA